MTTFEQAEQDIITLDFTKWSQVRRKAGLSQDHGLWQTERDRTLARQRIDNAAARNRRMTAENQTKAEKQKLDDIALDAELEPTKLRLRREWLAANPDRTEAEFEAKSWPLLRQNLVEERQDIALQNEIQSSRSKASLAF